MRWAVEGCSPACSLMCVSETGAGWLASTSSSPKARSSTCIVGVLLSVFAMLRILAQLNGFLYRETSGCHPGGGMRRSLLRGVGFALLLVATAFTAAAQAGGADYLTRRYDFGPPAASAASAAPQWIRIPRVAGRITAKELGLVINTADPYSIEVGEFYAKARGLTRAQVLRVQLPVTPTLSPDEFKAFAAQVDAFFDVPIQALALAWVQPYAVHCNSITGALALGYDRALCDHSCAASARSRYFDNGSTRPYSDLK